MITFLHGNIFDSKCSVLVNPVNCVGVMGSGLALEFKKHYPLMFEDYARDCRAGRYSPGCVTIVTANGFQKGGPPWIANFATKNHWRNPSRIEWIEYGLPGLKGMSVAIPAIGCGRGGLAWVDVRPLIEKHLGNEPFEIEVYEP